MLGSGGAFTQRCWCKREDALMCNSQIHRRLKHLQYSSVKKEHRFNNGYHTITNDLVTNYYSNKNVNVFKSIFYFMY